MLIDKYGRQFRNLRVSLTAACNYACTYCVPDGKRLLPAREELDGDDLLGLVSLIVRTAGISKVRLTGGEPLLSPKFDNILMAVMALPLEDVSLTTNGQLVPRKMDVIKASGLSRINLSLDTLNADHFRDIARSGDLATVLKAVDLLQEAGVRIKINMVPMKGVNDDQVLPLLDFCLSRDIELRFIELMNMGHLQGNATFDQQFFGMQDLLDRIGTQYEFEAAGAAYDSTSVRYAVSGGGEQGHFGIIANESAPFCAGCSRLRIASNGRLYGCLSSARSHDLRPLLEMSEPMAMASLQRTLGSALSDKQTAGFRGEVTVMKFIGG